MRRLLLSLALLLTLGAGCASAAVTFDVFSNATAAASPMTGNLTLAAGSNAVVIYVGCMNSTAAALPTAMAVTFNSVALTQVGTSGTLTLSGNNRAQMSVWMTTAQPTTGASLAWNVSWTNANTCYVTAESWIGTSTSTPAGNFASASGTTTLATVTVPNSAPAANNNAASQSVNFTGAGTLNQTLVVNDGAGCCESQDQRWNSGGGLGGLFTVSFTSRDWATSAAEICAPGGCASSGGATPCVHGMLGVFSCDEAIREATR